MFLNSASSITLQYEPLRSIGFAGITGAYAAVGTAFVHPVRVVKFYNDTNANLIISTDGVTDHDFAAATSGFVGDIGSNRSEPGGILCLRAGQTVYVRSEAGNPTSGNFYLVDMYAA